jgi:hypothetical protein
VPGELGVEVEAIDRTDLREQLRRGERSASPAARAASARAARFAAAARDRARRASPCQRAAAADELARDPRGDVLLEVCKPTTDAIELRGPVKRTGGNGKRRVELVQLPTQPLLARRRSSARSTAVSDEQLQHAKRVLVRPRPAQARFAQSGASDSLGIESAAARVSATHRRPPTPRMPASAGMPPDAGPESTDDFGSAGESVVLKEPKRGRHDARPSLLEHDRIRCSYIQPFTSSSHASGSRTYYWLPQNVAGSPRPPLTSGRPSGCEPADRATRDGVNRLCGAFARQQEGGGGEVRADRGKAVRSSRDR